MFGLSFSVTLPVNPHADHSSRRSRFWCRSLFGFSAALACLFAGANVSVRATTVVPPEFPALVNESDFIVHAIVKNVSSEKRMTVDGSSIVTLVELQILEVVAGQPPQRLRLEMLGGRVGDEELIVTGMPKFKPGDEDILFIRGNGQTFCPLYGMMYGRYPIAQVQAENRKQVMRGNGAPLNDTAEIALPMPHGPAAELVRRQRGTDEALSPAEFIRKIREVLTPNARSIRAK